MVGAKAFGHFALFKVARRKATKTAPLQSCVDTYALRERARRLRVGQIAVIVFSQYSFVSLVHDLAGHGTGHHRTADV